MAEKEATPRTDALMDVTSPIGFKGQAMVNLAHSFELALGRRDALLREALPFVHAAKATNTAIVITLQQGLDAVTLAERIERELSAPSAE